MQFSIYANFDRVYGQNRRRYWNIIDYFLKWNPKRSVSNKKNEMKLFILKFAKKCYFLPKNEQLTFEHDK